MYIVNQSYCSRGRNEQYAASVSELLLPRKKRHGMLTSKRMLCSRFDSGKPIYGIGSIAAMVKPSPHSFYSGWLGCAWWVWVVEGRV